MVAVESGGYSAAYAGKGRSFASDAASLRWSLVRLTARNAGSITQKRPLATNLNALNEDCVSLQDVGIGPLVDMLCVIAT